MGAIPERPPDTSLGKVTVVVPTYNERENLESLVERVLALGPSYHLLVVDDNSPDGTGELADRMAAQEPRVTVRHRSGKLGLGTAYIEGFRQALAEGAELVAQMDADGSHDPGYLAQLVEAAEDADVVVGSRYLTGVNAVNWGIKRVLLSKLANLYVSALTRMPVRDATAGFVVYRRQALEAIRFETVRSRGYAFQIEMKYRAQAAGLRLKERSIIFFGREAGGSKLDRNTVWESIRLVLRLGVRERVLAIRRACRPAPRPGAAGPLPEPPTATYIRDPFPRTSTGRLTQLPVAKVGGPRTP